MNKDREKREPNSSDPSPGEKSLAIAIEQLAKMLRTQTKSFVQKNLTEKRQVSQLPSHPGSLAFFNEVSQVARLLRDELHAAGILKKRKWKKH